LEIEPSEPRFLFFEFRRIPVNQRLGLPGTIR
jgi:hypothetical protein